MNNSKIITHPKIIHETNNQTKFNHLLRTGYKWQKIKNKKTLNTILISLATREMQIKIHNRIKSQLIQNSHEKNKRPQKLMKVLMPRKKEPYSLLDRMQTGTASVTNNLDFSQKSKSKATM